MEFVVFAKRFKNGSWEVWEHKCSDEEIGAVEDSARAKAVDRLSFDSPVPFDYLHGARYIFDVAYGVEGDPKDGDTVVHGVCVNGILIGTSGELTRYSHPSKKVA